MGKQAKARRARKHLQQAINVEDITFEQARKLYKAYKREGCITYVRSVNPIAGSYTLETLK